MFPVPQMFPPNTSRPEHASGWPCLDGQVFPLHFFLLLPISIKHLAGRRQHFCTWEEVSLSVSIAVPPQMAQGQGPAVTLGAQRSTQGRTPY